MLARLTRYLWLLGLTLGVFGLDQVTKLWIEDELPFNTYGPPGHIEIVPGFFNLVHVGNTGAAWSLLSGRSTLLALLAVITLAAIFLCRRHLALDQRPVLATCGCVA